MIALLLKFVAAPLGRWAALSLAGGAAIVLYTAAVAHYAASHAAARVETRIVTRYLKAEAKEAARRATVLDAVEVHAQREVARIARRRAHTAIQQKEAAVASAVHDHDACLGADGVRRLAAVGLD